MVNYELHDKVNEAYYGNLGPKFMEDTRKRIHWIGKSITGNKILDVGCSQGIISILLAREGKKVIGIDIDNKSIEEAKEYLSKEEKETQDRVKFLHTDYVNTNLDSQFDTIIIAEVLEHLMNPEAFVAKAKHDLVENGELIITVPFGINEFVDHKQTYYYIELFEVLSKYFFIKDFKIIEKWIGFICINNETENQTISLSDIKYVEESFYKLKYYYITSLNNQKINFQKSIQKLEKEKDNLEDDISELQQKDEDNLTKTKELEALKSNFEIKIEQLENTKQEQFNKLQNLKYEKSKLEDNMLELRRELNKITINFKVMDVRNKRQAEEIKQFENEIRILRKKRDKYETNFKGMEARNRHLKDKLILQEKAVENIRNTLSFRYGNRLLEVFKSPWKLASLPVAFFQEYKSWKEYQQKKKKKQEIKTFKIDIKKNVNRNKINICVIMDEFTYHSFKDEADLHMLSLTNWKEEIDYIVPDFLFIESAWHGNNEAWTRKISNLSEEFRSLVTYAKNKQIPIVFWNKEDPIHFDTFLETAKLCDVVYTTDIDSVACYKKVGINNAFYLPFAAQPSIHNPIELFERKDKVNFAGSYYLRYPERQEDFENIINAVSSFKQVEIYDRNYDNPHPHYTFPKKYRSMIIGKLPPEEIDKAYKGYRYGINMNTIKYSQSMFARRVYELLASNTIVISNFSRGMRYLFGDLVITSDNEKSLKQQLQKVVTDEIYYKKLRLLGLRKVLLEHTYGERLKYIIQKLGLEKDMKSSFVHVVTVVENKSELDNVVKYFQKQSFKNLHLYVLSHQDIKSNEKCLTIMKDVQKLYDTIKDKEEYISYFSTKDYYGENYLLDMILATKYYSGNIIGKSSFYIYSDNHTIDYHHNTIYKIGQDFQWRRSIVQTKTVQKSDLEKLLNNENVSFDDVGLAIDEFNYCEGAAMVYDKVSETVDDISINSGLELKKLYDISESMPPLTKEENVKLSYVKLDAQELHKLIKGNKEVKVLLKNNILSIKFNVDKHVYLYARKIFTREELNLVFNSEFEFNCKEVNGNICSVFIFLDEKKEKLSHSMSSLGGKNALAIPNECKYIKFGIRVEEKGYASIGSIQIGKQFLVPEQLITKSDTLVLTKQYPSYEDLYKYGFLHTRIKAYKDEGLEIDVFRVGVEENSIPYREFENVDVASFQVNYDLLNRTLASGQIKKVLVHLIDDKMWNVLEKFIDKIKVVVWVHGAEIQVWQRRSYEFERFTKEQIDRQKRLSDQRVKLWKKLMENPHKNIHFVFVSDYLKTTALKDLQILLPSNKYSIIHNYINSNIFTYILKKKDDRKNILSIRPYSSLTYANDLSVKVVLELSNEPFFDELSFHFVGDGELFEETIAPLKKFDNVRIERRFLTHDEIAALHKKNGIFLTPSRMDTQGASRDEAMSSGLVPVTTKVAAIPEFVDESCAIFAAPGDYKGLAEGIKRLYLNPRLFLEMSENSAKRVRKQSGYAKTILKEIGLIKEEYK